MTPNPPLHWRMPPLIFISVLLHAGMLIILAIQPRAWASVLSALVANHLLLTLIGMWPRSSWLGPNWTALPPASAARGEIALTIDDGPDPAVTPEVLDMLDRYNVKVTFFCIGEQAARYPALCKDMAARGHALENHSQHHHLHFALMGMKGLAREIEAAQQTLGGISGRLPQFFRAPAGLRNPFLDPVLAKQGLRLAAWTRRGFDTRTGDPELVTLRLLQGLRPGAILLLHDGNSAPTAAGVPVILAVLPMLLEAADAAGLRFVTLSAALQPATP